MENIILREYHQAKREFHNDFPEIFSYTDCHNWFPLYDLFRNFKKEFEINIASLKLFSPFQNDSQSV